MSAPAPHVDAAVNALRPPPDLTVDEWADVKRVLSQEEAAEPGPWDTSRTPYLREIMEVLSASHPARDVTVMKGAQVGGTEVLVNFIGYVMEHSPGPSLAVMPTEDTARDWSRDRLGSMIRSTPSVNALYSGKSRDPNNTITRKKFPGGFLKVAHATSASQLRSKPIRYLVMDEVDGYPEDVDGEGDPCELAERRTSTYGATKKIVRVSTPTFETTSRIEPAYEASDQRKYFVPCPHCDHYQTLRWDQLQWPKGKPEEAMYCCEECGCLLEESDKTEMLDRGEWRATNPDAPDDKVGFHLSALYSPDGWMSWADCAKKFHAAVKSKSKELLRTFVNTILGETWRDVGETPDHEKLYLRRGGCERGKVVDDALVLTAGVDVQGDRLECEIVAWGQKLRSWSVDYVKIHGDPAKGKVWDELDTLIHTDFPHESGGEVAISRVAIDAGYETQHVRNFCRKYSSNFVMAVIGRASLQRAIGSAKWVDVDARGKRIKRGAKQWKIGVNVLKEEIYSWLLHSLPEEDEEKPRGWCEWPEYSREYFRGITAEEKKPRGDKITWVKTYERNEPLDCRVYARAASIVLGIDRWDEDRWQQERKAIEETMEPDETRTAGPREEKKPNPHDDWLSGVDEYW